MKPHGSTSAHVRTHPVETNSRVHNPVFVPTPGAGERGGVQYLLDRRMDRPQNQYVRSDKKTPPLPGIEHRSTIAQPCQCTDSVIPAPPYIYIYIYIYIYYDFRTLPSMRTV